MDQASLITPDNRVSSASANGHPFAADTNLSECEAELRDFLENAAVAMHSVAEDGAILWANRAEMEMLGYSPHEYIGHNIAEFHADQPVIEDILTRLKRGEKLTGYECRLRAKDGSIRYVSLNSSVRRKAGEFVHTRCVTLDITGKKYAEELGERLETIVETSDDAIIGKDLNGTIQSWNAGAERIFGYTAKEVIGKHISIIAAPDRVNESSEILARVARGERVDHYETRRKTKDGRILTVSLTVSPVRNHRGVVIGASKVLRDTTHRTLSAELKERLAAIVESSDDAIISKDLNGYIQSWNRGAERLFGYTAEEIIGKHISTIAAPEKRDEIPDILERLKRGERVEHYQTKRKTKDGRILTVSLTVSPIRDAKGTIIGASKVARDITMTERQERALREANEALIASNADLQQFAYSASHDLQEPLRMVATYSELLMRKFRDKLGPEGMECVGYTLQGALRMEELLKALRAYTLSSTTDRNETDYINADTVLDKALANLAVAIGESGASITRSPLPRVKIHEFQLEQLFQNLIGNAIRYKSSAPPDIRISATQQGDGWLFAVQDNGIGIDPKYKEQIFGLFKRLHSADEYPGSGMGLAICKRIVERAGGRIRVESEPGCGSTFYFTLP